MSESSTATPIEHWHVLTLLFPIFWLFCAILDNFFLTFVVCVVLGFVADFLAQSIPGRRVAEFLENPADSGVVAETKDFYDKPLPPEPVESVETVTYSHESPAETVRDVVEQQEKQPILDVAPAQEELKPESYPEYHSESDSDHEAGVRPEHQPVVAELSEREQKEPVVEAAAVTEHHQGVQEAESHQPEGPAQSHSEHDSDHAKDDLVSHVEQQPVHQEAVVAATDDHPHPPAPHAPPLGRLVSENYPEYHSESDSDLEPNVDVEDPVLIAQTAKDTAQKFHETVHQFDDRQVLVEEALPAYERELSQHGYEQALEKEAKAQGFPHYHSASEESDNEEKEGVKVEEAPLVDVSSMAAAPATSDPYGFKFETKEERDESSQEQHQQPQPPQEQQEQEKDDVIDFISSSLETAKEQMTGMLHDVMHHKKSDDEEKSAPEALLDLGGDEQVQAPPPLHSAEPTADLLGDSDLMPQAAATDQDWALGSTMQEQLLRQPRLSLNDDDEKDEAITNLEDRQRSYADRHQKIVDEGDPWRGSGDAPDERDDVVTGDDVSNRAIFGDDDDPDDKELEGIIEEQKQVEEEKKAPSSSSSSSSDDDENDEITEEGQKLGDRMQMEVERAMEADNNDDPKMTEAAIKIQAAYKGYKTRNELKTHLQDD